MKVKFVKNYTVQDTDGKSYKKGETVELSDGSANHFIKRGAAEAVTAKNANAKK